MTGNGSRFKAAGYNRLKPFITVHGRPILEWIVKMFPGDRAKITFIVRQEHLDTLDYAKPELERIAPDARLFPIRKWEKKGPVFDIMQAAQLIRDDAPVLISYCDFYMQWPYEEFKNDVARLGCDGAIPCYSGFHPHLVAPGNLYASCKVDEDENLIEIREKFSWETDKTRSRHSPGVYYFRTGAILKQACQQMMDAGDQLGGEFYASLPYNYLVQNGLDVWCPVNVTRFCQWGTPQDLEEYLYWMQFSGKTPI